METEESKPIGLRRVIDIIFIVSSIILFTSVSIIFLATKFGNMMVLVAFGALSVSLIVPFTVVLIEYVKEKVEKQVIISLAFILFYLLVELTFDYILRIPFREILALHIFYIIVFYIAAFNMIGVSFKINRRMGWLVTITFWITLACLIYLFLP